MNRRILIELPDGDVRDEMLKLIVSAIHMVHGNQHGKRCGGILTVDLTDEEMKKAKEIKDLHYKGGIRKAEGKNPCTECKYYF